MIAMRHNKRQKDAGFALLLTLVVVSVVLAIGLILVDITLKQLTLSGTGRDSEIAFHAAHAGAECAQYTRYSNSPADFKGSSPTLEYCLGNTSVGGDYSLVTSRVHLSQYELDWTAGSDGRCTQIDMYLFDAANAQVSYDIEAYDQDINEVCPQGSICTFVLSRGYSRSCDVVNAPGNTDFIIQREVILEL